MQTKNAKILNDKRFTKMFPNQDLSGLENFLSCFKAKKKSKPTKS